MVVTDGERPVIGERVEEGGIECSSVAGEASKPKLVVWRRHGAQSALREEERN